MVFVECAYIFILLLHPLYTCYGYSYQDIIQYSLCLNYVTLKTYILNYLVYDGLNEQPVLFY